MIEKNFSVLYCLKTYFFVNVRWSGADYWDNIGLGNGLMPDSTKPLPEPMLSISWLYISVLYVREMAENISTYLCFIRNKYSMTKFIPDENK